MNIYFENEKKSYSRTFLELHAEREKFKRVLDQIWQNRNQYGLMSIYGENDSFTEQQLFSFHDTYVVVGNYIGTIKYEDTVIHILPKILENGKVRFSELELLEISNKNLLWWLSRCSKIKFPKTFSNWNSRDFSFIDVLIHLYSKLTRDDLVYNKHQSYVEQSELIGTVRGRIDFAQYSLQYFNSNQHVIPCVFDNLEIDNLYNQIVKFTSKILYQNTENDSLKKVLEEIIWILDDVNDVIVDSSHCDRVIVSPLNDNMKIILDYCRLFLSGMSIKTDDSVIEIFTILLPTDKLFEDFIFGFIEQEFQNDPRILALSNQGNAEGRQLPLAVKKDKFGAVIGNSYRLKPDIYISRSTGDIILDTKYKALYKREEEIYSKKNNNGIPRDDIYQMLAYTIKLDVKICHLLFPKVIDLNSEYSGYYQIDHENQDSSRIYFHRIQTLIEDPQNDLNDQILIIESELFIQLSNIINTD